MKIKFHAGIFLMAMLCLMSSFQSINTGKLKIIIKKGILKINKINVSENWKSHAVRFKLGVPDKSRPGYNTTHTYNDLGIVLFEVNDSILNEFQVYFSLINAPDIAPYSVFRGILMVDKLAISGTLSKEVLYRDLSAWNPIISYSANVHRAEKDGFYIYFEFSPDELNLNKVSIGKKI